MDFIVESTKGGKLNIVYKENRFREIRKFSNGDISWRCTGYTCGASLRTDAEVKILKVGNAKHTGDHRVIMREAAVSSRSPAASPGTADNEESLSSAPLVSQPLEKAE